MAKRSFKRYVFVVRGGSRVAVRFSLRLSLGEFIACDSALKSGPF